MFDWHRIGNGLALDWLLIDIGLGIDRHRIGMIGTGSALDWDRWALDWHWIDLRLAQDRHEIAAEFALDWH